MKHINIGEAELEIMKVVWKADEPIGSTAIGKAVEEKGWKRTTIATFLARLVEKGALSAERRGKAWYYTPILTAKEYKKSQVKILLKICLTAQPKIWLPHFLRRSSFRKRIYVN